MSERTIYKRVERREIPFLRLDGRLYFDRVTIDRWMESHAIVNCGPVEARTLRAAH